MTRHTEVTRPQLAQILRRLRTAHKQIRYSIQSDGSRSLSYAVGSGSRHYHYYR